MDSASKADDSAVSSGSETVAERDERVAWEAERVAEADAELDSGLYVDALEMKAWIESLGTLHELPPPPTRRR